MIDIQKSIITNNNVNKEEEQWIKFKKQGTNAKKICLS